ncbi:hypothetical protein DAEQUDRAFT_74143 [Daedalea quercina L-15889]|uniref:Uncharacterized protein n=1 Tax=Daedalea quercina L-15889 TaxID=1314783 RepID=A0A165L465_9APHY|nr:hypothetical protein DAEQUDRAFT_74143 [Daedalea quercina L-15889]
MPVTHVFLVAFAKIHATSQSRHCICVARLLLNIIRSAGSRSAMHQRRRCKFRLSNLAFVLSVPACFPQTLPEDCLRPSGSSEAQIVPPMCMAASALDSKFAVVSVQNHACHEQVQVRTRLSFVTASWRAVCFSMLGCAPLQ